MIHPEILFHTQRQWTMIPHTTNFSCVSHGTASLTT